MVGEWDFHLVAGKVAQMDDEKDLKMESLKAGTLVEPKDNVKASQRDMQ